MVVGQLNFRCVADGVSVVDRVPEGCCMFVRGRPFMGSLGRLCVDGSFCPSNVFSDPSVFVNCPSYKKFVRGNA